MVSGTTSQSVLPVVNVLQGSKFELHNLPLMGLNYCYGTYKNPRLLGGTVYDVGGGITGTYLPWYKADAYIVGEDFRIVNGELVGAKTKLSDSNDMMYVDTCVEDGTKYLLACDFILPLVYLAGLEDSERAQTLRSNADAHTLPTTKNVSFTVYVILRVVEKF